MLIHVLVAIRSTPVRTAMITLLTTEPQLNVVAAAGKKELALHLLGAEKPDLIMIDLYPFAATLELAREVRLIIPETVILVLVQELDGRTVRAVIEAGINSCVCRSVTAEILLQAIYDTFLNRKKQGILLICN